MTFIDWLAGFIEGEGTFVVGISTRMDFKHGIRILPRFNLQLHHKEQPILKKIQKIIGGNIHNYSYESKFNAAPQISLCLSSIKDCLNLRNILKNKLYASKKKDFILWSIVLEFFKNEWHRTKEGIIQIAKIRDMMNLPLETKKKQKKGYRTTENVINIIKEKEELLTKYWEE
jgi:hypothetical protein